MFEYPTESPTIIQGQFLERCFLLPALTYFMLNGWVRVHTEMNDLRTLSAIVLVASGEACCLNPQTVMGRVVATHGIRDTGPLMGFTLGLQSYPDLLFSRVPRSMPRIFHNVQKGNQSWPRVFGTRHGYSDQAFLNFM